MRPVPALVLCLALASLAPTTRADFITGQVVTSQGVPVAGIDIDAKSLLGGGDPDIFNDGTGPDGVFLTTIPAGQYRITFTPPTSAKSLVLDVEPVTVLGTTNMGVIVLPPGVAVSGHVQDAVGLPVAGVNIDIVADGDGLTLPNDSTDAFGNFTVIGPLGPMQLRLDATPVLGQTLASKAFDLDLAADHSLGTVVLPPGFHLTALVTRTNGTAVVDADTDTVDVTTGKTLYTPGDSTDGTGFVDVVVPAGTFDFEVCPSFASKLVATAVKDVTVAGNMSLGTLVVESGVVLSGAVTSSGGGLAGIDVDVRHSGTGVAVTLCGDDTGAGGSYAVVVPTGTFDVTFTPPFSMPFASKSTANVPVTGNTILNASLPDLAFSTAYGGGLAGSGGFVPSLGSSGGAPRMGNPDWTLEIGDCLGGKLATVFFGFAPAAFPFKQGTILVDIVNLPFLQFTLPLSGPQNVPGAGAFALPAPAPTDPIFIGLTWYAQVLLQDPGAAAGFAMSNGLHVTYLP